jgi:hypothetical protein
MDTPAVPARLGDSADDMWRMSAPITMAPPADSPRNICYPERSRSQAPDRRDSITRKSRHYPDVLSHGRITNMPARPGARGTARCRVRNHVARGLSSRPGNIPCQIHQSRRQIPYQFHQIKI